MRSTWLIMYLFLFVCVHHIFYHFFVFLILSWSNIKVGPVWSRELDQKTVKYSFLPELFYYLIPIFPFMSFIAWSAVVQTHLPRLQRRRQCPEKLWTPVYIPSSYHNRTGQWRSGYWPRSISYCLAGMSLCWVHWQFTCVIGDVKNWEGLYIDLQIGNLIIWSELDWSLRKCTLYEPLTSGKTSNQFCNKLSWHVLFRKNSRCGNLLKHLLESLILISRLQGVLSAYELVFCKNCMDCLQPGWKLLYNWLIDWE